MSYVIEQGVPLIKNNGRPASEERKAMRSLQVGDSFLIDDERRAQHARWLGPKLEGTFSIRKVREGWRVWRLA